MYVNFPIPHPLLLRNLKKTKQNYLLIDIALLPQHSVFSLLPTFSPRFLPPPYFFRPFLPPPHCVPPRS